MKALFNRIDLALCVDLTGSMTPFIDAAKRSLHAVLAALEAKVGEGLRLAIVGYRDHDGERPPVETKGFCDAAEADRRLQALVVRSPPGNTDAAEAVLAGLDACLALPWREGAYRIVVLVGDAPPHACGANGGPYPDRFPERDPTGFSLDEMANRLETEGVFVHALAMMPSLSPSYDKVLEEAFRRLAVTTGGALHQARTGDAAMAVVEAISRRFLDDLDFDARLLDAARAAPPDDDEGPTLATRLSAALNVPLPQVHAGFMRLRQRRLWRG